MLQVNTINYELDTALSRANLKSGIISLIDNTITSEVVEKLVSKVEAELVTIDSKINAIENVLPVTDGSIQKPEKGGDFTSWNLQRKNLRLITKREALNRFLNSNTTKALKTTYKVVINAVLNSSKDSVVNNAIVKPLAKIYGSNNAAMNVIETLSTIGILTLDKVANKDTGAIEHMVGVGTLNLDKLRVIKESTSDRLPRLSPIDTVEGMDITGKRRFPYFNIMEGDAVDGIDALNTPELSFVGKEDDIELLTLRKLNKESMYELSSLTEAWHHKEYAKNLRAYNLIKKTGNRFQINHQLDGVGRSYEMSDFFGVQQNSLMRHCIELANKEVLDDQGIWAVKMNILAENGYDKCTEEEAMEAWDKYENTWREEGKSARLFHVLDNPDEATGLLVEVDAQTQGFGLYSLLAADKKGIVLTGFLGDNIRTDGYKMLSDRMGKYLGSAEFTRAACKSPFMTRLYGAKYKTLMYGSRYDEDNGTFETKGKQVPLMITSDKDPRDTWWAFNKAMGEIAPRALNIMDIIEIEAKKSSNLLTKWTMPDGFVAQVASTRVQESHINWVESNGKEHSCIHHEIVQEAGVKPSSWAPRIIQSFDAYIGRTVASRLALLGVELVLIHDGYMTHPNYTKLLMSTYREVAAELLEGNWLSKVMTEITGKPFNFQARGEGTVKDILQSKYALWF